eukprot:m.47465 g.47465  ORF g.47465 m.47465 type:complete len:341 (-) comp6891_c0_seq1:2293-3315(-)
MRVRHPAMASALVLLASFIPCTHTASDSASDEGRAALHAALWRDGHVYIPNALPSMETEVAPQVIQAASAVLARCARCTDTNNIMDAKCRGCHRHAGSTGPKSFNKARNLHRSSSAVARLVTSPRLLGLAAGLLGTPRARLYQDTLFEKEAGDVESAWHQDTVAAPLATDAVVTLWVALSDVSAASGTLMFANGSHHAEAADGMTSRGVQLADRVASVKHLTDEEVAARHVIVPPRNVRAGDATAHLGWTLHRAPPNMAGAPRRALAITYFADGARVPRDLIALPGVTAAQGGARGVELQTQDGVNVVVQLLSDDVSTWIPWAMYGRLVPGEPLVPPPIA